MFPSPAPPHCFRGIPRTSRNISRSLIQNDFLMTATGGKSWHFRYYWLKEPKRMSLGTYPEVSLREARALRDQAWVLVAKDINPRIHRKQKRSSSSAKTPSRRSTRSGWPIANWASRKAGRPRYPTSTWWRCPCLPRTTTRSYDGAFSFNWTKAHAQAD